MVKLNRLRTRGAIPERQHDAFLLALLIAVSMTIAAFIVQDLAARLAHFLRFLGPEAAETQPDEEESYPFVLVDPSFLDEEPDPDQLIEAESDINRRARQEEARPDLPEAFVAIDEGIEEILTAPEGNPGPASADFSSPGDDANPPSPDRDGEITDTEETAEPQKAADEAEQPEMMEVPETPRPAEAREQSEPAEPPPETTEPPDMPREALEPLPEIDVREAVPPPVNTEAVQEASPEPLPEMTAEEPPPEEPVPVQPEETAEAADEPEPEPEIIELASLPVTRDGFFEPEQRRLDESMQQASPAPRVVPQYREVPREAFEAMPPPAEPAAPATPRTGTARRPARTPEFKQIGGAGASGGAPPRRNATSAVRLLDADASMAYLAHKYGPYMRRLAEKLQAALVREMILSPNSYGRGQVKVRFGISPDGTLTYYTTVFPDDGTLEAERLMSERMLRDTAPFEELTPAMARDENFQRMTVIVHLY